MGLLLGLSQLHPRSQTTTVGYLTVLEEAYCDYHAHGVHVVHLCVQQFLQAVLTLGFRLKRCDLPNNRTSRPCDMTTNIGNIHREICTPFQVRCGNWHTWMYVHMTIIIIIIIMVISKCYFSGELIALP